MASGDGAHHPDPDDLALLALDPDEVSLAGARSHLEGCAACAREVAAFGAVVAAARAAGPGDADDEVPVLRTLPGPAVWEGIAAATGVRTAPDPDALHRSLDASPRDGAPPHGGAPATGAPALPRQARRGAWSTRVLLATAVLALVAGAAGGLALGAVGRGAAGDAGASSVVSSARLEPLSPDGVTGRGTVEVLAAGTRAGDQRVVVSTTGLPRVTAAVHEVWLLDPTTGGLLPLGYLVDGASPSGGYAVPDGVDLQRFSTVDVSAEPLDGDERHSGTSELRGSLQPLRA